MSPRGISFGVVEFSNSARRDICGNARVYWTPSQGACLFGEFLGEFCPVFEDGGHGSHVSGWFIDT